MSCRNVHLKLASSSNQHFILADGSAAKPYRLENAAHLLQDRELALAAELQAEQLEWRLLHSPGSVSGDATR